MEERTRSESRRTRFIDDGKLKNVPSDNTGSLFEVESTIPVLAVLHDAVPDLGHSTKKSGVRIAETTPTLANLTTEFNDLSRKMTVLKETIKVGRNAVDKKKLGSMLANSSSQALQVGNLTNVAAAKLLVHDCIVELTSINHFLDGNAEIAAVYREKLRHEIGNLYGKAESIMIQEVSFAPDSRSPIPRRVKIAVDAATGASDYLLNQYGKEAAIQTDADRTEINEVSNVTTVNQPDDASVSWRPVTGEANKQSKRAALKNKFKKR